MFFYSQKTGEFYNAAMACRGYSGFGVGRNNPAMQAVHNVGPLPRGEYTIGPPHDTDTHGPVVMALTPNPENEMFGRGDFLIHGDSIQHPGSASHGCIVLPHGDRCEVARFVSTWPDTKVRVIE